MAEVMQPLLQTSNSITMLQPRPSSETFQGSNTSQNRNGQAPRGGYNSQTTSSGTYRGTSAAPVQPYAFQSTPHLRQETRTLSAPAVATMQSPSTMSSTSGIGSKQGQSPSLGAKKSPSREDIGSGADCPSSIISLSSSIPDLSLTNFDTTPKSSPNRYRRGPQRSDSSSVTQQATVGSAASSAEQVPLPSPPTLTVRTSSDDAQSSKFSEAAKRYRRRSLGTLEASPSSTSLQIAAARPASSRSSDQVSAMSTIRSVPSHQRNSSNGSAHSIAAPSTPIQDAKDSEKQRSSKGTSPNGTRREASPIRSAGRPNSDANKRLTSPSPLSQPAYTSNAQSPPKNSVQATSPAAQHLAALSDKDLNKGMKSRLRRAFSFGSAAELRKASAENAAPVESKPQETVVGNDAVPGDELDDEQAEIARRQEAAGIGAGIYSGQGGFSGSTDNLSISSTASSASMMLRKMGRGMKKSGRSLKGLFRPKSVVGVPAADGPIEPSLAQVSMVTVEAERQKVNVNAHPAEQVGGATGYPKLERNSIDVSQSGLDVRASNDRNDSMRKSIVGSDVDRAEVLAAVKKGILKRSATSSPQGSPVMRPQSAAFTDAQINISPASSVPGTPRDERQSRSLTSTNSSSDYFSPRMNGSATRSMPATPVSSRNISFSPRIQFHDVWSSTEYDRRGDIATCNRLTPMLAQQIKEELNTFKMEMEVHEMSKPHTHFF